MSSVPPEALNRQLIGDRALIAENPEVQGTDVGSVGNHICIRVGVVSRNDLKRRRPIPSRAFEGVQLIEAVGDHGRVLAPVLVDGDGLRLNGHETARKQECQDGEQSRA